MFLDHSLKCKNIIKIFNDSNFPSSQAEKLGIFLGIPSAKVEDIKRNNQGNVDGMMIAVLIRWLQTGKNASWKELAGAVERCEHPNVAEKIRLMCDVQGK